MGSERPLCAAQRMCRRYPDGSCIESNVGPVITRLLVSPVGMQEYEQFILVLGENLSIIC